eukprot:TCONS_00020786-protein
MAAPSDDTATSKTIASEVPFHDFAVLCEKISKTQGKERKKALMQKFIGHWRRSHQKMHGNQKTIDSFFPAMRLTLPQLDKERAAYGMKEVVLAKYYIEALGLSKDSTDAKKLLNYRAPNSAKQEAGDFASVAFVILKSRCPEQGSMTIENINNALDSIAQANVEKERDTAKATILKVIRTTSALEQKWFIRVMLKEMKFGLNENSIFPLYHKDALELFNVCNSLSKVCLDLHDENIELNETEISLFTPFRPMLGQRVVLEDVEKLMHHRHFIIETKIDGERMQMHKNEDEYRYFSRNSNDYSENFGITKYRGSFTPHVTHLFKEDIKTCILDGEMVGFDDEIDNFVLKGSNIDIKSDHLVGVHPCFVVFDVLMVNGENLANVPLEDRIKRTETLFDSERGRLEIVERKLGKSKEDVINSINKAVDKREEGIVIKDPSSIYKPSKRKGSGWLKLKPEYVDALGDDLDLIILGGEYGSGKRRGGMISHFLLGVAVTPDTPGERPTKFMTFGKVGSGYSDKELKSICDQLNPHWKKFQGPTSSIIFTDGCKEKPDVVIEPRDSIIVQIKASEITPSDKYKCQCTMRFPRMERVRDDKSWFECMTFDELEEMKKMADGRLSYKQKVSGDAEDTEDGPSSKKKRRTVLRVERPRSVAQHLKGADITDIQEVSNWLNETEFCVINGPTEFSKQKLEQFIVENGGTFVQNPTAETKCVIVEKTNFRAKNIISRENVDVVKASWFIRCLEEKQMNTYQPSDIIFATETTKSTFNQNYDQYGDHYTQDIENPNELKQIFDGINVDSEKNHIQVSDIASIEQRYFHGTSKYSIFRRCRLFVPTAEVPNYPYKNMMEFVSLEYCLHGGTIVRNIDQATHILLSQSDDLAFQDIRAIIRTKRVKPQVITELWIRDSIDQNKMLEERPYKPA